MLNTNPPGTFDHSLVKFLAVKNKQQKTLSTTEREQKREKAKQSSQ